MGFRIKNAAAVNKKNATSNVLSLYLKYMYVFPYTLYIHMYFRKYVVTI